MMGLTDKLLSDLIVSSIGWMLLHSLWQGLIITILCVLMLLLFKKGPANIRYLIGVSMLILMVLVSLLTFLLVYQSGIEQNTPEVLSLRIGTGHLENSTGGFFTWIKNYFDRNLPAVVALWLMGMMFFFLKFVSGILFTQRLRHHQTREVSQFWKNRISGLKQKLNIKPVVSIKESLVTGIPLTIGYFKPLILFPVGMLSRIPPDQVEALLVHELAHIRRRDYLLNIFQNIVDIIYFYHPGIRWISHQVRGERENCCDDITVEHMGDSLTYARALTRVGEFSLEYRDGLAMAASRGSSGLFKRIRRLFAMRKERSKSTVGLFGFLLMVVFAGSLVLSLNASCWLFAGPENAADVTGMKREDPGKDDAKRLMERYEKLAARESSLTDEERKQMEEIEAKLIAIKKMDEQKKLKTMAVELERLKAKNRRTEAENHKLQKLAQFLEQYEFAVKLNEISRKVDELKNRERHLSEEEQEELRRVEEKLKQHQMQEARTREEERRAKDFALQASRGKERYFQEQERELEELELKAHLKEKEMELKKMELKREYERLEQETHRLSKKKKLTEKEKDLLQKLKEKQEQIRHILEIDHQ